MAEEASAPVPDRAGVQTPGLSVVLVADTYESIAEVMAYLREQTACAELEIVVAARVGGEQAFAVPEAECFASVRVVPVPADSSLETARAQAAFAAAAPIVFFGETHSFPQPGFTEALIAAHGREVAAVVPAVGNANPGAISWANLILDYGPWIAPRTAREIRWVPDYNCSYKRSLLVAYGRGPLVEVLEGRGVLPHELRARGQRFLVEPAARLDHLNVSAPGSWLRERFLAGRILGGTRAARWTPARRLAYLGLSLVVPLVHLVRSLRVALRLDRPLRRLLVSGPALVLGSLAWTTGEIVGYTRGTGPAAKRMVEYELNKASYALRASR